MSKIQSSRQIAYFHYLTYTQTCSLAQSGSGYTSSRDGRAYVTTPHPTGAPRAYSVGRDGPRPYSAAASVGSRKLWMALAPALPGRATPQSRVNTESLSPASAPYPPLVRDDKAIPPPTRIQNSPPPLDGAIVRIARQMSSPSPVGTPLDHTAGMRALMSEGLTPADISQLPISIPNSAPITLLDAFVASGQWHNAQFLVEAGALDATPEVATRITARLVSMAGGEAQTVKTTSSNQLNPMRWPDADTVWHTMTSPTWRSNTSPVDAHPRQELWDVASKIASLDRHRDVMQPTMKLPPGVAQGLDISLHQRAEIDAGLLSLIRSLLPHISPRRMQRKRLRRFDEAHTDTTIVTGDAPEEELDSARYQVSGPVAPQEPSADSPLWHATEFPLHHLLADLPHLSDVSRLANLEIALKGGANVNRRAANGLTPLHLASRNPYFLQLLLDHGAQVRAATDDGLTPLHMAASQSNLGCLNLLLSAGSNPLARDIHGRIPLEHVLPGRADAARRILAEAAERVTNAGQTHPTRSPAPVQGDESGRSDE